MLVMMVTEMTVMMMSMVTRMTVVASQEHRWERHQGLGRTRREAELFPQKNSGEWKIMTATQNTYIIVGLFANMVSQSEKTNKLRQYISTNHPAPSQTNQTEATGYKLDKMSKRTHAQRSL